VSLLKGKISAPPEGYNHEERWKCGKISGFNRAFGEDQVHDVILDGGIRAREAVFRRPLKSSRLPSFLFNIPAGPSVHFINFRSSEALVASMCSDQEAPRTSPPIDRWKTFELDSAPIAIVGWSLSCGTATKKTTVVESSGGILDEFLTIKITESPKGDEQWHCRVTFVYKEEYDGFLA